MRKVLSIRLVRDQSVNTEVFLKQLMYILLKHYNGHTATKIHGRRAMLGSSVADLIIVQQRTSTTRVCRRLRFVVRALQSLLSCVLKLSKYMVLGVSLHATRTILSPTRPAASYYHHQLLQHSNIVLKRGP